MASDLDIPDALGRVLARAVNLVTGTRVAAIARTERYLAPGSSLWLCGTSQVHAEIAALTAALHLDDGPVLEVWLTASRPGWSTPCGSCRQLLLDYSTWQGRPIDVVAWDAGVSRRWTLAELLPEAFVSKHLRRLASAVERGEQHGD